MKAKTWKKIHSKEFGIVERFLRRHEIRYVSACARFLQLKKNDEVWGLPEPSSPLDEPYSAILLHCHQSLFPVFGSCRDIPLPAFLNRVLLKVYVHAINGPAEDAELLENLMKARSYVPSERIDYNLMDINATPAHNRSGYGPLDLILRAPEKSDADKIYELQAAYEQEEVLPKRASFYPAACRANLNHLLKHEEMLLACIGSEIVGKVNTNAKAFTRYQIGGVYVKPGFRGRGIASRMTAVFLESLIAKGCGANLFVKKSNAAAKTVYARAGLTVQGDYRISYF